MSMTRVKANSADDKIDDIFLFSQIKGLDISCKLFNLHETSNPVFLEKDNLDGMS